MEGFCLLDLHIISYPCARLSGRVRNCRRTKLMGNFNSRINFAVIIFFVQETKTDHTIVKRNGRCRNSSAY